MENQENHYARTGIWFFKYSLLIGTALFLSFAVTHFKMIAIIGLFYVIVAAIVNLLVLSILLFSLLVAEEDKLDILKSIGLICLNIPIAILYLSALNFFNLF